MVHNCNHTGRHHENIHKDEYHFTTALIENNRAVGFLRLVLALLVLFIIFELRILEFVKLRRLK